MWTLLKRLWFHLSVRRRRQFMLLLLPMLLASFAETLSIGAVLPFLGLLTAPEHIFALPVAQPIIHLFELTKPEQLLLPLTIIFGALILVAGALRLLLLWMSTKLCFAAGTDLSISIYNRTLYQSYAVHCSRNSSQVIAGISGKANGAIYNVIVPSLTLITASVMFVAILATLLMVEPIIALIAFGGFGLIYMVIVRLTSKQLQMDSKCVAEESVQVIKSLQEGLGGIRDVLIDGSQSTYCQIYRNADISLRRAQGNSVFVSGSPRFGMEALGMVLIVALAYWLAQQPDGITTAIPILGALALGAQRLLPVMQQAYGSWIAMSTARVSLEATLELLDQPLPENQNYKAPISFDRTIRVKQLGFRYGEQMPYVFKNINLTITKGSRVGFIGTTGSGKSTLLDIVMGLLQPVEGALEIDDQPVTLANNRAWQAHIAHVPQAIFLADCSIEENIAFGVSKEKINYDRVRQVAQQAQIAASIEGWAAGYQTVVGERGIRLSGGQRQRIGIARALYKQANVIIFDEATSALDNETEQAVMQAIESLSKDLTLLIIAHRLSTLKNCTQIVELGGGSVKRIGAYDDLFG